MRKLRWLNWVAGANWLVMPPAVRKWTTWGTSWRFSGAESVHHDYIQFASAHAPALEWCTKCQGRCLTQTLVCEAPSPTVQKISGCPNYPMAPVACQPPINKAAPRPKISEHSGANCCACSGIQGQVVQVQNIHHRAFEPMYHSHRHWPWNDGHTAWMKCFLLEDSCLSVPMCQLLYALTAPIPAERRGVTRCCCFSGELSSLLVSTTSRDHRYRQPSKALCTPSNSGEKERNASSEAGNGGAAQA